jgi:acyl carrier protein
MNNPKDILPIKTKVLKLFGSQLDISMSDKLIHKNLRDELGMDSIKITNVIVMLEKLYHIPICDEECEAFNTIDDFIHFIDIWQQKKYFIKQYRSRF